MTIIVIVLEEWEAMGGEGKVMGNNKQWKRGGKDLRLAVCIRWLELKA